MHKNVFQMRTVPTLYIVFTSILTLCIEDGQIFRILFGIVCLLALFELISFRYTPGYTSIRRANLYRGLEFLIILGGLAYVFSASQTNIALLFFCAWGADALAWFVGNTIGGKIIKISPFPYTAPTKTIEGTLAQFFAPILAFWFALGVRTLLGHPICGVVDVALNDWYFACIGPCVFLGDIFASKVKRSFGIKNSSTWAVALHPFYRPVKNFLGAHGGWLDRIDSVTFSGAMLLFLGWFYTLFC